MTAVLPRSASQSTVEDREYGVNEAITNLPDVGRQMVQDYGFPHLGRNWRTDETLTSIELSDASVGVARYVLRVLTQDEVCLVQKEMRGPLVLVDLPTGTPGLDAPSGQFSFSLKGSTSFQDVLTENIPNDSTSPCREDTIPPMLQGVLDSLYGIKAAAIEDECDQPSDLAINNAEVVLREMFAQSARLFDIYPMVGGEIAIDAGGPGRRLGVFCYPDGRVQYVGLIGSESEEIRQDGISSIPIDFLRRVLSQPDP